ncbi:MULTISPECIES: LysR family transcriptional regulator [unclassified Bradyrhizobium]|uniref:LysR family transcriptional regulator n=1 Tax=unclassified Bradyrhizobium TaxID=2631580 RepID=UPI0024798E1F|nr:MULTISPECIES: LysR family transcriptional regulator [unclassified Bradyrhizobium]WGS22107.1 LysR family transcriptional regulator [Bradyrhizobium sp. ISRA463]WGS29068.1 LysR family transcriptional regulator [Bradyrhizobium sp. ISRA464]
MSELPRTQALRCFITVAREGTVSRAASVLKLTQPAVSLQLKALEESTGLQLFNRTPGGFTLTEAGVALLPLAHKAVAAASDFKATADSLKETQRGTLRVGTILDAEFTRLGPFVRTLATSAQRTEVFLRHGVSDDVLAQIGRSELDVGYYVDATPADQIAGHRFAERTIADGRYQLAPLLCYDYRVIAPIGWSDRVMGKDWAELARLPWLATPTHSGHRRLLDDIFRPLGALPKRVAYTDQEEAMIDFVESGICLSLARDSVLAPRLSRPHKFVVADKVKLTCDLSFACLAARRQEPAIARAFTVVRALWNIKPTIAGAGPSRSRKVAKNV